jgi:hypothetical protein
MSFVLDCLASMLTLSPYQTEFDFRHIESL